MTALAKIDQPQSVAIEAEYDGLRMAVSPAEALRRVQELQAFVREVMVNGTDYGVIPGTGERPTLYQPGAQKLAEIYSLAWTFEDMPGTVQDWTANLFVFRKRCVLTSRRDGRYIGDGVGSCNSKEDRYAFRWVKQPPPGIDPKSLKMRTGKWGPQYRLTNEDICSLVNTMEKMACKRALVHAVLGATRSSGMFTQDVEDLPREVFGEVEPVRSWEDAPPQTATPVTADDSWKVADEFMARIKATQNERELPPIGAEIARAGEQKRITEAQSKALRAEYAKMRNHHKKAAAKAAEPPPEPPEMQGDLLREPGSDG